MSKYDDWVQCEEDSEMLIYEEWQRYTDEVRWAIEADWEDWVNSVGWSDQGVCHSQRSKIIFCHTVSEIVPLDKVNFLRQNTDNTLGDNDGHI